MKQENVAWQPFTVSTSLSTKYNVSKHIALTFFYLWVLFDLFTVFTWYRRSQDFGSGGEGGQTINHIDEDQKKESSQFDLGFVFGGRGEI